MIAPALFCYSKQFYNLLAEKVTKAKNEILKEFGKYLKTQDGKLFLVLLSIITDLFVASCCYYYYYSYYYYYYCYYYYYYY